MMAKKQVFKVLEVKPDNKLPVGFHMMVVQEAPKFFPVKSLAEEWIKRDGAHNKAYTILDHWEDEKYLE
jgi:hypothetical protein